MDLSGPDLERELRERFGFDEFRAGQRACIEALLGIGAGRGADVLAIQPTGHGKSLLYQLPAALLPGITIVVSPLLALVRDQVGQLRRRFDLPAASINSDQSDEENDDARAAAAAGELRLLFVSPEHLDHEGRFEAIARLPVALLVVDEAHCVSTWGHDFRPAYRQIVRLLRALRERRPSLRVLALTATADARVEADIRAQIEGGAPLQVFRSSMDRPNLALATVQVRGAAEKLAYLEQIVPRLPAPGLLYCATRERTELVAEYLSGRGLEVAAYHAGLDPERKRALQDDFLRGRFPAIAATNALGMGIDKSDLRYVLHVDVPGSITAYYQEVGRAGRDGRPARGILLFDAEDRKIQDHFIDAAMPELADFTALLAAIEAAPEPPGLIALKVASGLHPTRVTVVIAELVEQGFVAKRARGSKQVYELTGRAGAPDLERYRRQGEVRGRELAAILTYAQQEEGCLMATLRRALGDPGAEACGRCSLCRGQRSSVALGPAVAAAAAWLEGRAAPIAASARPAMSEGLAARDGELGGPLFGWLMKHRADATAPELPPALAEQLVRAARALAERHQFVAAVALPSQRWAQRASALRCVAAALGVPAREDLLRFRAPPAAPQAELANNDQRRDNVEGTIAAGRAPAGDLLLLDDLIGSGATFREAGRALRKEARHEGALVPLAAAKVRRRLGARGG